MRFWLLIATVSLCWALVGCRHGHGHHPRHGHRHSHRRLSGAARTPKAPLETNKRLYATIGEFFTAEAPRGSFPKPSFEGFMAEAASNLASVLSDSRDFREQTNREFAKLKKDLLAPMKPLSLADTHKAFDAVWKQTDFKFLKKDLKKRFKHFKMHVKRIVRHNRKNKGFKMGLNQFALLSDEEFRHHKMKPLPVRHPVHPHDQKQTKHTSQRRLDDAKDIADILRDLPASVNWSKAGMTTPVKNQNNCNGCYAYSALGALESALRIAFKEEVVLSEQEIVDCSGGEFGNNGCVGGQPSNVYEYIKARGINLVDNYPEMASNTSGVQTCRAPTHQQLYEGLTGYDYPEPNVISLIQYLQISPVAVNHFVPDEFKYYLTGIFDSTNCFQQTQIDHSTLLVGYEFNAPTPYFILKNSYGRRWGENGFYRVPIGPLTYDNPGFCYLANNGYNVAPVIDT